MYTNPEDDWSDLGLDTNEDQDNSEQSRSSSSSSSGLNAKEQKMLLQKNNSNKLKGPYRSSVSPSTINEDDEEASKTEGSINTSSVTSPSMNFDLGPKVQNWTEVIRNDAPKRTISSPMVTYTQKEADNNISGQNGESVPQVRRKSSELSVTMKTRLEAFNSSTKASGDTDGDGADVPKQAVEPDGLFKQKLQAFRKISEGQLNQTEIEKKPKPPMTISSLLGGGVSSYIYIYIYIYNSFFA